jgi:hypothetical protein
MGILHEYYLEYRNSITQSAQDQNNTQQLKDKFVQRFNSTPTADLYETDEHGYSILAYATFHDDTDTVSAVLQRLPQFNASDVTHYFFPLLCAVDKMSETNVRLILAHGADINAFQYGTGATLLHLTAMDGAKDPTKLLLNLGADITAMSEVDRLVATDGRKTIFDYAFNSETTDIKQKIEFLNYLFLWAWSKNITVDLTGITIDPALTENLIVFNALLNGSAIAQFTPNFEKSITNFEELLAAPNQDFNYEDIFLAIKRRIEDDDTDTQLLEYASKIRELWLSKIPVEIKEVIGQTLFAQTAAKKPLSAELAQQVDALAQKLVIIPGKTATMRKTNSSDRIPPTPPSSADLTRQLTKHL